jgi:hypothetical protein
MFSQTYFCLVTHSLDKFMVYLDFTHQTGILRCPTTAGLTPEVIVVISRETSDFLDMDCYLTERHLHTSLDQCPYTQKSAATVDERSRREIETFFKPSNNK